MDVKTQAIVNQLIHALSQAQSTVAELCGEIAVRDARIAELVKPVVVDTNTGDSLP